MCETPIISSYPAIFTCLIWHFVYLYDVLTTFKPTGTDQNPLFVLYSDSGDEQLQLVVGELVELYYEDTRGDPPDNELLTFRANVADGR